MVQRVRQRSAGFGMILAFTVAAATTAGAADLAVRYNVEDKPLKAAVSGTPLTFDLYADSSCITLIHTFNTTIDDVLVSKLKLFTPKGGTKPPKIDTIETTIPNLPVAETKYVKVTGTGITPYPGPCQTLNANPVGKVVSVSNHTGFIPTIPTATTTFLVNPVYVQLTTNQIIVASATAELGSSAGSSSFQYGICLQPFPAGPIGSLSGQPLGTATADTVKRPFPSSAAGAPGVGMWQIGFCVSTLGPALDTNGQVSGTVVVSQ